MAKKKGVIFLITFSLPVTNSASWPRKKLLTFSKIYIHNFYIWPSSFKDIDKLFNKSCLHIFLKNHS